MQFLNPAILIGLLAASIPLILHLINLKRNKVVEFSSNRFLEQIKKSNIRNVKIRNLILLILRMLIIACIVFAFARPVIESDLTAVQTNQPSSNIIIVDNSFSMDMPTSSGDMLSLAKNKAKTIVNQLPKQSEYIIYDVESAKTSNFLSDRTTLFSDIDQIGISGASLDLNSIESIIQNSFDRAQYQSKNVFLLSDNQVINGLLGIETFNYDLSTLSPQETKNAAIDSILVTNEILIPEGKIALEVYISNSGSKEIEDNKLTVYLNDKIITTVSFSISPDRAEVITVDLEVPKSGRFDVRAMIEQDMLSSDNEFYLTLAAPPFPKVAVLGENAQSRYLKSLFASIPDASVVYINKSEISSSDLSAYNVLVLSSATYSSSTLTQIENSLSASTNAIVFAPLESSDRFQDFLMSLGFGAVEIVKPSDTRLDLTINEDSPILSGIYENQNGALDELNTSTLYSASQADNYVRAGGYSLMSIANNYTQGYKTVFVGVSSDLTYSDLPLSKVFAPFIYRSTIYLAGVQPNIKNFYVSRSADLEVSTTHDILTVVDPNQVESKLIPITIGNSAFVDLGQLLEVGNYSVLDSQGDLVYSFSVNHNPLESKIEYQKIADFDNVIVIDDNTPINDYVNGSYSQSEIWQLFVIVAILLAILELWIGNPKNVKTA